MVGNLKISLCKYLPLSSLLPYPKCKKTGDVNRMVHMESIVVKNLRKVRNIGVSLLYRRRLDPTRQGFEEKFGRCLREGGEFAVFLIKTAVALI